VRYCEGENLYLVTRCDSTAHHTVSGISNCNGRRVALVKVLNSTNLEILNRGNNPTFYSSRGLEVIDITPKLLTLLGSVKSLGVSFETSLWDHKHFLLTLHGPVLVRLIRNPRDTNWDSFREGLRDRLERDPQMNM